mmetsp:Transcript_23897/g.44926  ORF Transcript_23897/g.44926 Transcript_23897/m.44926 type:complete len:298 (-) Transcript_23897:454-1347(-)
MVGEGEGGVAEGVEELLAVCGVPGGEARQHLKEDHAQVPPVTGGTVPFAVQNFGGKILGGAAQTLGPLDGAVDSLLGEPKVRKLHVTNLVKEDILGLEIAIDDSVGVELLKGQGYLGRVEASHVFGHLLHAGEVEEEFAARTVVKDEEKLGFCLEGKVQVDDEGVVDGAQNPPLGSCVLYLLALDDIGLLQDLHGKHSPGGIVLNQRNLSKRPLAYHLDQLEVIDADLLVRVELLRFFALSTPLAAGTLHRERRLVGHLRKEFAVVTGGLRILRASLVHLVVFIQLMQPALQFRLAF